MTRKNLIAGGLLVGSLVLGFAGQAEAANLVQKYDVTQYSNSHAFWLNGLSKTYYETEDGKLITERQARRKGLNLEDLTLHQALTNNAHFLFEEPGRLNVYDDGTASLTGIIYNKGSHKNDNDERISNANQRWEVDIKFDLVEGYSGGIKNPTRRTGVTNQEAYENWSFWEFAEGSVLTGLDDYAGSEINLYNRAFRQQNLADFQASGQDPKVRGQLGYGANDKNSDLGFSIWFGYTGDVTKNGETTSYDEYSHKKLTESDINVKLTAVPEPATMSLMSLGMIGLGASVLKRKQQS